MGKRVQMFYGKLRVSLRWSLGWIPRSCVDSFEKSFSFKNKETITSMGLIGHSKCFLRLIFGAPRSIHDTRLLQNSTLFQEIVRGNIIPNKGINLGDAGEIPL